MIGDILFSALVMTTPLVLAAMGGLIHRSSGVVNVGLDGMMLLGALVALIVASGGNWAVALACAAAASAVAGWLMSLSITRLRANEIIVGLGLNIAMAGAVRFSPGAADAGHSQCAEDGHLGRGRPGQQPARGVGVLELTRRDPPPLLDAQLAEHRDVHGRPAEPGDPDPSPLPQHLAYPHHCGADVRSARARAV